MSKAIFLDIDSEPIDIDKIEIKYQGETRAIGYMKEYLETGHAEYWFWHTLLDQFISLYRKTKSGTDFGILLPEYPIVDKIPIFEIQGRMSVGGYDKKTLFKMIDMYEFLLNINGGK